MEKDHHQMDKVHQMDKDLQVEDQEEVAVVVWITVLLVTVILYQAVMENVVIILTGFTMNMLRGTTGLLKLMVFPEEPTCKE